MDLSFCKICGERHALGRCLDWDEPPRAPIRAPGHRKGEPVVDAVVVNIVQPPELPEFRFTPDHMKQEVMPAIQPRFDRNAYQRELMRKRRAAAREQASEKMSDLQASVDAGFAPR